MVSSVPHVLKPPLDSSHIWSIFYKHRVSNHPCSEILIDLSHNRCFWMRRETRSRCMRPVWSHLHRARKLEGNPWSISIILFLSQKCIRRAIFLLTCSFFSSIRAWSHCMSRLCLWVGVLRTSGLQQLRSVFLAFIEVSRWPLPVVLRAVASRRVTLRQRHRQLCRFGSRGFGIVNVPRVSGPFSVSGVHEDPPVSVDRPRAKRTDTSSPE